jgi:CheY-like chemotaxis protein
MSSHKPIIIVEDDLDDQLIYREAFSDLKIPNPLLFFDLCDAAFNHLMSAGQDPFLILCDINLPRQNGIEFKRRIDETDYLRMKSIPFVFVSTAEEPQVVMEAYQKSTVQGYFRKPASLDELKKRLSLIISYWQTALVPR